MDWKDFIFPARKPLANAAGQGNQPETQQQPSQPAGLDIAGMAQQQARGMKNDYLGPNSLIGGVRNMVHPQGAPTLQPGHTTIDNQPTMQQLQGAGGPPQQKCPTCGK